MPILKSKPVLFTLDPKVFSDLKTKVPSKKRSAIVNNLLKDYLKKEFCTQDIWDKLNKINGEKHVNEDPVKTAKIGLNFIIEKYVTNRH